MSSLIIQLKLYKYTEKYIEVYLLQPLSAQEDLWGLSLRLQKMPHNYVKKYINVKFTFKKSRRLNPPSFGTEDSFNDIKKCSHSLNYKP